MFMPCFVAICVWSFRIIKHWKGKKRREVFVKFHFVCVFLYMRFRKQKKIVSESSEDEWRRLVDWSSLCGGGGRLICILADSIMEIFFCIFLQFQKHLFKMIFFKLHTKKSKWIYENIIFVQKNSLCCKPNIRSFV